MFLLTLNFKEGKILHILFDHSDVQLTLIKNVVDWSN